MTTAAQQAVAADGRGALKVVQDPSLRAWASRFPELESAPPN